MDKITVKINGVEVTACVVNTAKEFKWRLEIGEEVSEWYQRYSGLLTHKFSNGRTYGFSTQYFEGTAMPIEVPFEIVKGEMVENSTQKEKK